MTLQQFHALPGQASAIRNLDQLQKQILSRRLLGRNLHAPAAAHHILPVRTINVLEIVPQNSFHIFRSFRSAGRGPPSAGSSGQFCPVPQSPPCASPGVQNSYPGPPRFFTVRSRGNKQWTRISPSPSRNTNSFAFAKSVSPFAATVPGSQKTGSLTPCSSQVLRDIRVAADDPIENEQRIRLLDVEQFARKSLHFLRCICTRGVAKRIVIRSGPVIDHAHAAKFPEFLHPVPVLQAAYGIPESRRIHPLPAIVGGFPLVVRPEKVLFRVVNQHGSCGQSCAGSSSDSADSLSRCSPLPVNCQISPMIDSEMILAQMLMLGEVRSAIEFNPRRAASQPAAHHHMSHAREELLPWQLKGCVKSRIARNDTRIVPEKIQHSKNPLPGCRIRSRAESMRCRDP